MKMNLTVVIGLLSLLSLRNFGFCQDVGAVAIKPETADAGSLGSTLFIVQTGNASTETVHGQWQVTEPVTSISDDNKPSWKIRHRHQKGRSGTNSSSGTPYLSSKSYDDPASLSTVDNQIEDINYDETGTKDVKEQKLLAPAALQKSTIRPVNPNATSKPYRIRASGSRKAILLAAGPGGNQHTSVRTTSAATSPSVNTTVEAADTSWPESSGRSTPTYLYHNGQISQITSSDTPSGSPNLDNWFRAIGEADEDPSKVPPTDLENNDYENSNLPWLNDPSDTPAQPNLDIVTKFLRIVESQHLLGTNCTAGTDFNLGEGVVDRYAQERFRLEADIAVNRANWLTRLWKYAEPSVMESEYLLHANLFSMIEMDEDIFAAGNCHDKYQYKDYELVCPFAYRLPNGTILAKDLAAEYNYLTNTSEFFYIARKNAERVIRNMTNIIKGQHMYTANATGYSEFFEDEILSVTYEDGKWSKPYFDCGGGNIWMMTYTVPFFGYANGTYFFKGTSGIDIDLRRVDIDQCPQRPGNTQLNIFAASDKCKPRTTKCVHISGLGFRRGSYRCECKDGFYFPDKNTTSSVHYYNGTVIEEEYEKKLMGLDSVYEHSGVFECLPCPEGCDVCVDDSPCIVTLNWAMRTSILILEIIVICCLPAVAAFTWRYAHIKVVRAASPALLRLIIVGSFFIYCTTLVTYPRPNVVTCTLRIWFREIGFSFAYGALMLKTWRISVIFRVRSAKAVKITDLDLIKRLGVIVAIFTVFLSIRTLVAPPHVIVARTADDLKAYICQTDWWDHVFTAMEMVLLVWGIRLCIVVRKAPSEFNESRFISMAIYNEFLLSVFLNVSMLFLQSPANPDLMYIIVFSHTQLTTTLLLVLIFGSKAYLVLRGRGKGDDNMIAPKPQAAKFLSKAKTTNSHVTPSSMGSHRLEIPGLAAITDPELQEEIRRIFAELEQLREKNVRLGNRAFASRIATMLHVARQNIVSDPMSTESATIAPLRLEDGPSNCSACDGDVRQRKQQSKKKSGKSPGSPEPSGLGSLMFPSSGGPYVNNVLACMTDKIVCATFSADPNLPNEDDFTERDAEEICAVEMEKDVYTLDGKPVAAAPASSLAIAAAPLLTPSFSLSASMSAMLEGHPAATDACGSSYQQEATSCSDQKLPSSPPPLDESVLITEEQQEDTTSITVDVPSGKPQPDTTTPGSSGDSPGVAEVYRRGSVGSSESAANANCDNVCPQVVVEVDSTVKSAQDELRVRPQLNTSDRERFTDELTV